jgi:hypothetical protein
LEVAQITAVTERTRKVIARYARPTILALMLGSAALNALAFAWEASGWKLYPAVALGVVVPYVIYALMRVGVALWTAR